MAAGLRPLVQTRRLTYRLSAPFHLRLRIDFVDAGGSNVIGFFIQPETDETCRLFTTLWRDDLDGDEAAHGRGGRLRARRAARGPAGPGGVPRPGAPARSRGPRCTPGPTAPRWSCAGCWAIWSTPSTERRPGERRHRGRPPRPGPPAGPAARPRHRGRHLPPAGLEVSGLLAYEACATSAPPSHRRHAGRRRRTGPPGGRGRCCWCRSCGPGSAWCRPIQEIVPLTEVAHVGLRRDEATLRSEVYLEPPARRPAPAGGSIVCDPMLATGGSLGQVCDLVAERGAAEVMALCIIASEPGLAAFGGDHPGVRRVLRRASTRAQRRGLHRARAGGCRRPALRTARLSPTAGRSVGGYRPMSSCQSSGLAAMKSPSSSMHSRVVEQHHPAAVLGHPGVAALEVLRLADHHGADAELAEQPAAVPARRERGHHDAVRRSGAAALRRGRRPSRRAWRGPRPGPGGCGRARAASRPRGRGRRRSGCRLRPGRGAPRRPRRPSIGSGQRLAERRSAGDICSERELMSTTADRTYTTTVGSQKVELPLVALNDELTIALLICVDMGVAFAETAGRGAGRADAPGPSPRSSCRWPPWASRWPSRPAGPSGSTTT